MRQSELVDEPSNRPRLVDGAQILALDILNERDGNPRRAKLSSRMTAGIRSFPDKLGRAKAPLARHEPVSALLARADDDGLHHALRGD